MRGRRGVFVAACVFATLGILLVGYFQAARTSLITPGPLSTAHQQALQSVADSERCNSCHDAADADLLVWLAVATGNVPARLDGQAARCLKCHEKSLGNEWAGSAHNVSPEFLTAKTVKAAGPTRNLEDLLQVKFSAKGEIACSTCHREHHGSQVSLTDLTDQQCQACHKSTFESFAHGHPEFRHTLPSRRSRIVFDHVAHRSKHFPEKNHGFDCKQCHVDDARRDVKRLAGFEQSCAQCHDGPIKATSLEGLVAFSFPTLDVARLSKAGHDIGDWPLDAQGDFDGFIPPAVRLLLMADDEAAAALEQLGPEFDFSQTEASDQLRAVATLAWSYKRLLNDLANDSESSIRARIERLAGASKTFPDLSPVVRQLPPALYREARRRWLPQLSRELAARGREKVGPPATFSSTIYPQVRQSEPVRELLMENPLAKRSPAAVPTTITSPPAPVSPGETLVSNPLTVGDSQAIEPPPSQPITPQETTQQPEVARISDPSQLASSGTWYLDDATLSVRYRPRGHADELERLLIDVAAASTIHHVPHQGLLPAMLRDASLKTCATCHSIDTAGNYYAVNWRTEYRDTSKRQFTHFSHRPHLVQPRLADCSHCHQLNDSSTVLSNYDFADPMAHAHDFRAITKATCAACHTSNDVGSSCTTCHSYHVGSIRSFGK